ncbi:GNAT family N-acetyltransferase [Siccirubricoccus deserti]
METGIRVLTTADAAAFRSLRIEALRRHRSLRCLGRGRRAHRCRRLRRRHAEAGAGCDLRRLRGDALVGMAGFFAHRPAKVRHKGAIWGVYVQAAARGQGIAGRLMQRAIAQARSAGLERLLLTVTVGNAAAQALYGRLGFLPYGIEQAALRLPDGRRIDEELRALDLRG